LPARFACGLTMSEAGCPSAVRCAVKICHTVFRKANLAALRSCNSSALSRKLEHALRWGVMPSNAPACFELPTRNRASSAVRTTVALAGLLRHCTLAPTHVVPAPSHLQTAARSVWQCFRESARHPTRHLPIFNLPPQISPTAGVPSHMIVNRDGRIAGPCRKKA
jgi:hypothetical protein